MSRKSIRISGKNQSGIEGQDDSDDETADCNDCSS